LPIGSDQVEVGDEIDMEWMKTCDYPLLKKNGEYFIIGKDPTKYADGYVSLNLYSLCAAVDINS